MEETMLKMQVYVSESTQEEIINLAKQESRSLSNMINILILEALLERSKKTK
jgi:CopG-like RHH_1 or ribbon-helix-helix domain, RHH_5